MNTRIFTLVFIIATFLISNVEAQELSIVGGLNFSNMSDKDNDYNYAKEDNYKSRIGGHAGLLFGFDLSDKLMLQTGLLLNTKGFKQKEIDGQYKETFKFNTTYLDIPVLVSYQQEFGSNLKFIGGLGPVLGIAIGGKGVYVEQYKDEKVKESINIPFGKKEDEMKRIDFGLMLQAGLQVEKVRFGIFYNQGLVNLANYNEDAFRTKNRVIGISAAYVLDLKK